MNGTLRHTLRNITCVNHYFVLAVLLTGCQRFTGSTTELPFPYANTDRSVQYVGSAQCRPCHQDIYDAYMQSEMGRSLYSMNGAPRIERFPSNVVTDERLDFRYTSLLIDSTVAQRETRLASDGTHLHERTEKAEFALGSGNNLRMYYRVEGGMLYQLPLTWYVHKNAFDLSPGYRDFGNVRFSRFTSAKCLSCHNAYLTPDTTAVDRYQQPFELGVSCERCHGPGALHIRQANGESIPGLKKDAKTIIDPKTLPHEQQLDVCRQCHLQGKAWVLTKHNGSYFDFRPGERLSSHRSVYFKAQTKQDVVEVGDSPQRLTMSRCYNESNGALGCITCHDPHFSIKTFPKEHYNKACQQCHTPQKLSARTFSVSHAGTTDCVACHMNRTGNNNTLHGVSNTDHWIRVGADRTTMDWRSLRQPTSQPLARLTAFLDNGDSLSNERMAEAYLYYYLEHDPRGAYLDSALAYLQPYQMNGRATARTYDVLAEVRMRRGLFAEAAEAYRTALTLHPGDHDLLFRLGNALMASDDRSGAAAAFGSALERRPNEPKYLEALGTAKYRLNDFAAARPLFERSIARDAQNGATFMLLGNIHAIGSNDAAAALPLYRRAAVLTPDMPDVHLNLGNAYLLLQQEDSALIHYRLELRRDPRSVSALINLGRVYDRKGDRTMARSFYRKALAVDPSSAVADDLLR